LPSPVVVVHFVFIFVVVIVVRNRKHDTTDQLLQETVPVHGSDHMLALVVVVTQHYTHPVESWRPSPLDG